MESYVKSGISFIVGGLVGAGIAVIFLKKKYETMYNDAVRSKEQIYADLIAKNKEYLEEGGEDPEALAKLNREKPDFTEYAKALSKNHQYVDYSKPDTTAATNDISKEKANVPSDHEVIDPNYFGEYEDYGKIFLTYYSDGVLADSDDEILEEADIENCIGLDYVDHFGEFEEDSVHIRNDRLKCYYEILEDTRTFEKAMRDKMLVSDS